MPPTIAGTRTTTTRAKNPGCPVLFGGGGGQVFADAHA